MSVYRSDDNGLFGCVWALMTVIVLALAVVGALLFVQVIANDRAARGEPVYLPNCPEDSVLVGTGSYENRRWTAYECGPAVDDYAG